MAGYQAVNAMAEGQADQKEPLISTKCNEAYTPTGYETFMNGFGHVLGSVCCCLAYRSVNRGEVGLITQYGRYIESKEEGLHYVNMVTQNLLRVDTKRTTHALNKQTVLTSDNLQVQIDGVVFYHVIDPMTVAFRVNNYYSVIENSALVALRSTFGGYTLQQALEHRAEISQQVCQLLAPHMTSIGVKVEEAQITDIIIPPHIAESLAAKAVAERTAQAKIILAKADVESAQLMKECAASLATPAAMQIRVLDTLQKMAASGRSSVIFMPTAGDDIAKAYGGQVSAAIAAASNA